MKGFLILRCEGELRTVLVGVTGEEGARVRSVMEGEEDLELELDSEIVSVQRANLGGRGGGDGDLFGPGPC